METAVKITDTHTHTHPYSRLITCTTHTYISGCASLTRTSRNAFLTHTSNCLLESRVNITDSHIHTRTLALAWLIEQTHIQLMAHSSFTVTEAFPLRACSVTRSLRTYFTIVVWVFLDGRIADCTVRQPGVEHSFYSIIVIVSISARN